MPILAMCRTQVVRSGQWRPMGGVPFFLSVFSVQKNGTALNTLKKTVFSVISVVH